MKNPFAIALVSALITAGALKAAPAFAETPAAPQTFVSYVQTADLDLSSEGGQRTLDHRLAQAAREVCGKALIGSGKTDVEIKFPEQEPILAHSELLAFNGGVKGGVTTFFVHAYLTAPVTAAVVTTVKIKKIRKGRYGLLATGTVPKIAGGSGSPTFFTLTLKKGIVKATCPDGHLSAHGTAVFANGTKASGTVLRPCTGKG